VKSRVDGYYPSRRGRMMRRIIENYVETTRKIISDID